ncbi:signal peptidase I [uncultured Flavonifractor sp.]|uniref:signal peptidase I n=1 Tax=uncultured Flavonifractor sp. TaxID=1193534 RepID=UPI00262A3BE9|nr:signal peptidase I [uncultured Flavonifractor sp.]
MREEKQEDLSWSLKRELYFWLGTAAAVLTALILIFTFLGRIIVVDGISMLPTLEGGNLLLLQSVGYTPRQGDIVVLTKEFEDADGPIVKRVIATGGQRVVIDYAAGTVTVDGEVLDEPYINEAMVRPMGESLTDVEVPEGSIFVMGDNRNYSSDSRNVTLGAVDERYLLGKAVWVLFPLRNFGPAG